MKNSNYNLFLDDIRSPAEVGNYINPVELRAQYRKDEWIIVRNYDEFVSCLIDNELPVKISFDHDLADEHYTPEEYWENYDKNKAYQESLTFKEKTGYDCLKYLCNYCLENVLTLPEIFFHTMNPVGKENMESYLKVYRYENEV